MTVSLSVIGAPISIGATFADSSTPPVPVDPSTVAANITDPAGTTTTHSASEVVSGNYSYVYTPSLTGIFTYWFSSTSPISVQLPDIFTVVPAASGAIVSLADARAQLGKSSTTTDFELRGFILAGSEMITRLCGPTNGLAPVTETLTAGHGVLVLSTCPVVSIASVTPTCGFGSGTALDSSTYTVSNEAGLVTMNDGSWFTQATVVYTPGRSVVPASIQEACLLIVQQMWDTKRGGAVTVPGQGGNDGPVEADGFLLPPRAAELLQPYRLPPGVR